MENKVFVVTGTTSGIGKVLALEIAKTGQTLVMIARDADRGQSAYFRIGAATRKQWHHRECDPPRSGALWFNEGGICPLASAHATRLESPRKIDGAILQAAAAPEFASTSGKFLHEGKEIEAPAYAQDGTAQQRLWEMSAVLTGLESTKGKLPINDPKI